MNNDPLEDLRKIRKQADESYPNADVYFGHLQEKQAEYQVRLVKRGPRRSRAQAS